MSFEFADISELDIVRFCTDMIVRCFRGQSLLYRHYLNDRMLGAAAAGRRRPHCLTLQHSPGSAFENDTWNADTVVSSLFTMLQLRARQSQPAAFVDVDSFSQ